MSEPLHDWLAGLDEEQIARLLMARPDLYSYRRPRHLSDVAALLLHPEESASVMRLLHRPGLQVLEALVAVSELNLDVAPAKTQLAAFLAIPVEEVDEHFERYEEYGLAWRGRDDRVHANPSVCRLFPVPLALGPSIIPFLESITVTDLKQMCHRLELPQGGRKAELVDRLTEFYRDPAQVTALYRSAPADVQALLKALVWDGPDHEISVPIHRPYPFSRNDEGNPVFWASNRGLLLLEDYYATFGTMPLEVGLALRGADYKAPYQPTSPPVRTRVTGSPAALAHQRQAGLRILDRTTAIVDGADAHPIAVLKNQIAIGAREVRRLAKAHSCEPDEVYLALVLAFTVGLLTWDKGSTSVRPTDAYKDWCALPAGKRLESLVRAWFTLPVSALLDIDGKGKRANVLDAEPDLAAADVRVRLIEMLSELPEGSAAADQDTVAAAVEWKLPILPPDMLAPRLASALVEASMLGVVHDFALTGLGRALRPPDPEALALACEETAAGARSTVLLGADLTAVATGPPGPDLAAYLDQIADREAQDSATVWRFSPLTIRRALDLGFAADDLLAGLESLAEQGVPQPLSYLVRDVARRHGEFTVEAVASCVLSDDPARLREVLAHKKLAALEPRLLAPTVLASSLPPADTIALLRKAGYYPAPLPGGTVQLRPAPSQAIQPRSTGAAGTEALPSHGEGATQKDETPAEWDVLDMHEHSAGVAEEVRALARALVGTKVAGPPPALSGTLTPVGLHAPHLPTGDAHAIMHALAVDGDVLLTVNGVQIVLSGLRLSEGMLEGWSESGRSWLRLDFARITSARLLEPPGA